MDQLVSFTSLPNLHPALVHFPIVLLMLAPALDLASLLLRRHRWLDHAATVATLVGAGSAWVVFLSGRFAADGLGQVAPAAQGAISRHANMAWWVVVTALFLGAWRVFWLWQRGRGDRPGASVRRGVGIVLGALVAVLLSLTADLGGALVYRHGLGVSTKLPVTELAPAAPAPAAFSVGFAVDEDGTLTWTPGPGEPYEEFLEELRTPGAGSVRRVDEGTVEGGGLSLEIDGRATLLFAPEYGDLQADLRFDLSRYEGRVSLVHHFANPAVYSALEFSSAGETVLSQSSGGKRESLDAATVALDRAEELTLAVSSTGEHLKGFLNGALVTHGHTGVPGDGRVGLLFDGQGVVRILQLNIYPL